MKRIVFVLCLFTAYSVSAQKTQVGDFVAHLDVGAPKVPGNTTYSKKDKSYIISGGGYNIWFNRDEFQYAFNKLRGDFTLTANFAFVSEGKEAHRKMGWMIRSSLVDSAVQICATIHGDGLTVLQWRGEKGMKMRDPEDEIFAPGKSYGILQLQRRGDTIIMRAAEKEGDPLILIGEHVMENLPGDVFAGIFICSHNPDVMEQAQVWNVRIEK